MKKTGSQLKKAKKRKWKQFREVGFFNMFKMWRRRHNKHVVIDDVVSKYVEDFALNNFSAGLQNIHRETMQYEHHAMQIDPTEAGFLRMIVSISGARRILELGTFRGWSTAVMAEALAQNELEHRNTATDQTSRTNGVREPLLVSVEAREEQAEIARTLIDTHLLGATASNVRIVHKTARDFFDILEGRGDVSLITDSSLLSLQNIHLDTFDLIFIDADKANYAEYLDRAKKILAPGGLIILDNMLNAGLVTTSASDRTTQSIRELNEKIFITKDLYFEPYFIPAWDGVVMLRKRG